ncbi:hypothetical protein O6H91_20G042600 [Diphasiastrum complanatum]|uniref:Uncharacterized protein n=2 Tax=Diphasiastrum complanatum TaxID=34168 RepID=A0ACC2APW8_DIPCM|nr:hypothetical protein O6H91_20G042600 [Diphasiastrum complanatum]KAJ7519516.1 hypothetical protein O6H91_20G042600 [Diphasiastrum complanatum]
MESVRAQHKRVRFSYDEPDSDEEEEEQQRSVAEARSMGVGVLQIIRDNTPDASRNNTPETSRAKKLRFPKGKKESQTTGISKLDYLNGDEDSGLVLNRDPRVAATERAVRRNKIAEQLRNSEDSSVLNDVAAAEEDYEVGDQEDEDGVPLEPFNLKQEREEGYFDAEGNYVEYRLDREFKDAWLDSAEVDTRFAEKHLGEVSEDEEAALSSGDIGKIKRRIADALLPGETVLQALRRLKGSSKKRNLREKMSDQETAIFDQLTEDTMKLMDNGDYDAYHETKETFQREAEGYEAIVKVMVGSSSNGTAHGGHSSDVYPLETTDDIFASDEEKDLRKDGQLSTSFTENRYLETPPTSLLETGATTSVDMFGDDEKENPSDEDGSAQVEADKQAGSTYIEGNNLNNGSRYQYIESGYIFDAPSGYYYNQDLGYYYDSISGLFCNASSGKWFSYEEESGNYVEVS